MVFFKRSKQSLKILQQQRQMLLILDRRLMISHYNLINTGNCKCFPIVFSIPPASQCMRFGQIFFLNFIMIRGAIQLLTFG